MGVIGSNDALSRCQESLLAVTGFASRKRRLTAVFTVKTRPKLRLGKTCDSINSWQRLNVLKGARRPGWSPWSQNLRI